MISQTAIWFFILLAVLLANLPWFSARVLGVVKLPEKKLYFYFLEVLLLFLIVMLIGLLFESQTMGNLHPQDWEFYATMLALFFTFTTPGFLVWLYRH